MSDLVAQNTLTFKKCAALYFLALKADPAVGWSINT